ncbi:MAG: glycosyltransferase family 39 protein [Chloroflexi bacterium]|nr:glycosyltransferase family 39 protein [Chloroflexota bacterium]
MRQLQFIWGLCGLLVAGLAVPLVGWVYSHELPAVYWLLLGGVVVAGLAWRWPRPLLAVGERLGRWLAIAPWQVALLALAPALAALTHSATGDDVLAHAPRLAVACWVAAVAAVLIGSTDRTERWQLRWGGPDWVAVLILLLMALIVRVQGLELVPTTLSGDEGSAGLSAVALGTGQETNWFGTGWFSFPSLYFLVQYLGIAWWWQTIFGLRFMSAVAGACTVPLLYWLLREMYGRPTAVAGAAFLVANHFHIHFSRIGLNNIWDGFFVALVLAALWQGWQTAERRWYLLAGFALGLAQYFYVSIRVLPLLILLWAGLLWLNKQERPRLRQQFPNFVLMAYTSLVAFLPLGLYFSDKIDQFMAPMSRVSIWGEWMQWERDLTGGTTADVVLNQIKLSALGLVSEPLRHWYTPDAALLLPAAGALFVLGLLLLLWWRDARTGLLLLPLAANILLSAFSQDTPASQRYIIASVMAAAIVGVPLGYVYNLLAAEWPRWRYGWQALLVVGLIALMATDFNFYFFKVYDYYVLGGTNTEVATAMAFYLRDQDEPPAMVYFHGPPRMGYRTHSTIPYLVPTIQGTDIPEPITAPPDWVVPTPAVFLFLPERLNEYGYVFQAHPGGRYREFRNTNSQLLFAAYEVR